MLDQRLLFLCAIDMTSSNRSSVGRLFIGWSFFSPKWNELIYLYAPLLVNGDSNYSLAAMNSILFFSPFLLLMVEKRRMYVAFY